jgi:glycosyltransferase EpsD
MKKILFTSTVDSHILNFHIPYLKWFKEQDCEVHVASNGSSDIPFVDVKYNIPFKRSPYKKENYMVYKQLKRIIADNDYKLIHCHTPMGSVLTRLATREARSKGTKVLYTAHGFHFYKGAPLKNWLLYYPIEKIAARWTDGLLTMNKEDYKLANKFKLRKAKAVYKVNGVGIDLQKFIPQTLEKKKELRKEYGYNDDDFILIYAAELNYNKHQDL